MTRYECAGPEDALNTAASTAGQRSVRFAWLARVSPTQAMLGLVILALLIRAIHLSARPLWLDEAYSAWFSARGWHYLWAVVPTYEPHPPFYYSILKAWRAIAGGDAIALRGLSVLFSAVTVPVMMAASEALERLRPTGRPRLNACICGFLAAASPMFVLLDQEARPYALMILAYAIATLGLLRLLREFRHGGSGAWTSWLMLGGGTELALWSHGLGLIYAACLAGALAPAWLAGSLSRQRLLRGLVVVTAVALAYAPCLAMMVGRVGEWGTGWLDWRPLMIVQLLALYTVPFDVLTVASAVGGVALLLLAKRALEPVVPDRGWTVDRALLVLWLAPPLIAIAVSALGVPVFLLRTLAPALVPFYLAVAAALARTTDARERTLFGAALVITLIATAVQVTMRPPSERWDEVRLFLDRNVRAGDEVWLYPNDSALPLEAAGPHAYARRSLPGEYPATAFKGPIRAGSSAVVSLTHDQAQSIAANPGARRIRTIWLVTRQSGLFDPQSELPRALAKVRRPGRAQAWDYIVVQPFTPRAD